MQARAVIGANFGDEGKGLITDWLCGTEGAGMVIRFNGGAQAGHTVVTPEGVRHVFRHFGSGTFVDVPTFLSQFFIVNPLLFFKELDELRALGVRPMIYADSRCLVTTFVDMLVNQDREEKRGKNRHGSCGVGIHETIARSGIQRLSITMADLWNGVNLELRLEEICSRWAIYRGLAPIEQLVDRVNHFIVGCQAVAEHIKPLGIAHCRDPVFEGAQGLLLDQDNREYFPHVTHSATGMANVRTLCAAAGIGKVHAYYVSRTYLTRHGAGKLPNEDPTMHYPDDTNLPHDFQGQMRFAPLEPNNELEKRCGKDAGDDDWTICMTHQDQLEADGPGEIASYGPTRDDVHVWTKHKALAHD